MLCMLCLSPGACTQYVVAGGVEWAAECSRGGCSNFPVIVSGSCICCVQCTQCTDVGLYAQ